MVERCRAERRARRRYRSLGADVPARIRRRANESQMNSVMIRKMRGTDLPRVMQIEKSTFTMPWSETTFRGLLRRTDSDLYVAELRDMVVGYSVFWAVTDQGELGNVAVAQERRGHGIGRQLVEAVLARASERGVREIFLEVRKSNAGAQNLYRAFGFSEIGKRRNYYLEPAEDALVMRLDLPAGVKV
ncbi:MAG: ribosomal protein S18-alanine N-acetyltransferase [Gemmatimonadota bacterium]